MIDGSFSDSQHMLSMLSVYLYALSNVISDISSCCSNFLPNIQSVNVFLSSDVYLFLLLHWFFGC